MSNRIATTVDPEDGFDDGFYQLIRGDSAEQLKDRLGEHLAKAAFNIRRAAIIVRRLEELGEDLSGLKLGIIKYLRLIAHGQLLPELVTGFSGQPRLLSKIASLPITDQKHIVEGGRIKVLVIDNGKVSHREVAPQDLTPREVAQVFGDGEINNDAKQRGYLEAKAVAARTPPVVAESNVTVDVKRGRIVVAGVPLTRADLADYLARLERGR